MKKKVITSILIGLLALSIGACGDAAPAGPVEEEVENQEITLTLEVWDDNLTSTKEVERTGKYTGTLVDGIPNGKGKFETQNEAGDAWYYSGDFKDGRFEGQGISCWEDDETPDRKGTYKNGLFTPDLAEFCAYVIPTGHNDMAVQEKSIQYIKSHPEFFPAKDELSLEAVKSNMDSSVEYKHLQKNVNEYLETFVTAQNLYAAQVQQYDIMGHTITMILGLDQSDYTMHTLYYPGNCDIFQGDAISYIGLPLGFATFDDTNGGQTWSSILLLSDIW